MDGTTLRRTSHAHNALVSRRARAHQRNVYRVIDLLSTLVCEPEHVFTLPPNDARDSEENNVLQGATAPVLFRRTFVSWPLANALAAT